MAVTFPHSLPMKPLKRSRRTATAILAGDFDVRPQRDVLTSLLNGVGPYTPLQRLDDDEVRRQRKKEKKEREREAKRARRAENPGNGLDTIPVAHAFSISMPQPSTATGDGWHRRPAIHIATLQRSISVTPPPFTSPLLLPSTPASTPGPSNSSSTSRTSSKRPRTPDDYEDLLHTNHAPQKPPVVRKPRRRCQERVEGLGGGLSAAVGEVDQPRCGARPPGETNAQRQKFRCHRSREGRVGVIIGILSIRECSQTRLGAFIDPAFSIHRERLVPRSPPSFKLGILDRFTVVSLCFQLSSLSAHILYFFFCSTTSSEVVVFVQFAHRNLSVVMLIPLRDLRALNVLDAFEGHVLCEGPIDITEEKLTEAALTLTRRGSIDSRGALLRSVRGNLIGGWYSSTHVNKTVSCPPPTLLSPPSCLIAFFAMALTHIPFPALPIPPSWFPGHMMKFTRMLPTLLTQTDVVLELRDSRLPLTSINRTLEGALQKWRLERGWDPNNPTQRVINSVACERIVVFNKRDLVPEWGLEPFRRAMSTRFPDQQFFFASWQRPRDIKSLSEILVNIAKKVPIRHGVKCAGYRHAERREIHSFECSPQHGNQRPSVCGFRTPKALQTGAHPGLTQALSTRLKLSLSPLVYAFDSPGVMLPFLGLGEEGAERGVKLALIAGIKEGMYDIETLAAYLHYRLNILNPISPAYLRLLLPGATPTIDIEEFLGALAGRMGMVTKGAVPDLRRAATYFVRWWREEGGLISASSALGVTDPFLQGSHAAITHGWGFDLEWQLSPDEIAGTDHAALIQSKMEACIDKHLADIERQELSENNVSATQRKKQQALKEQMQRKLKYEQKYLKRATADSGDRIPGGSVDNASRVFRFFLSLAMLAYAALPSRGMGDNNCFIKTSFRFPGCWK
ncbi:Mitochondrial GTPase 1 [Mycena sanguinolenta]|uniref:Mitochondrial GTPase 1 n=1 Tax=Mycena sanguinolenta TaxID=230812 RepID=A0A8H6XP49_9AGAR|nr:Mitochondrial GTPase 1 [Mycena sanguinolenta]